MNRLICLLSVAAAAGCSSSPANVAGNYTVNATDEANGCNISGWQMGSATTGISVTITQSGDMATVTINGVVGTYVKTVLGSSQFDGTVDGDALTAQLFGTTSATMNGCEYTYDATLDATLATDTLTGTITYVPKTNGSPDCSTINGCSNVQDFNGTRPPM